MAQQRSSNLPMMPGLLLWTSPARELWTGYQQTVCQQTGRQQSGLQQTGPHQNGLQQTGPHTWCQQTGLQETTPEDWTRVDWTLVDWITVYQLLVDWITVDRILVDDVIRLGFSILRTRRDVSRLDFSRLDPVHWVTVDCILSVDWTPVDH